MFEYPQERSFNQHNKKKFLMMDKTIKDFYRDIFSDLSIDREETSEIKDFLTKLNPPPDKLVSLRASAFSVGCEFLQDEDNEANIQLLRCINVVVHYFEVIRME